MAVALDPATGVEVATDAVARARRAGADAARVNHRYSEMFEVNFDTQDVTLVRSTINDAMSITVFDGTRKGSSQLTGRSHDQVDVAVAQALEAARAGEPDPANVLPEEAAQPVESSGDEEPDRDAMVDAVLRHLAWMKQHYPAICSDNSVYKFESAWSSYANSYGRTQQARRGRYLTTAVVTAKEGTQSTSFNYAGVGSLTPFADIGAVPAIKRLLDETVASFDARAIPETFVGDVIITPAAMSTLVGAVMGAVSGMSLLRGATPYADKLGAAIAPTAFTVAHRPSALATASPFDGEGFANRDIPVIANGVLENFLIDWYFSHKLDRPMTTGCSDFIVEPGEQTLDAIIAGTERGIVLGRYSGGMPNSNLDFSGVAKNSFYVENGKIVHPINETMIAGNFVSVLESITAISRETLDYGSSRYPWIATSGVTVSTK